jgi:hypothetical protein
LNENSSTASSPLFNGHPSVINLGSLLQQSYSIREEECQRQDRRRQVTTSSLNNSRASGVSFGGIRNHTHSLKAEPRKPAAPVPIGRLPSPAAAKDVRQLRGGQGKISREPVAPAAQKVEGGIGSGSRKVKQVLPTAQERGENVIRAKSPHIKYFQSRNQNTSNAARSATRRRSKRRNCSVDSGNMRTSN